MAIKTLAERYADLIAGKYTGTDVQVWRQIERDWNRDEVLDHTMAATGDGPDLQDAIAAAIGAKDHVAMLVLCDQAETAGVSAELCDLTRQALRVQYPNTVA